MKYIAYSQATGNIKYFYDSNTVITQAPENLDLLEVDEHYLGSIVDTHEVINGQLVLKQ
jgi:hypothetical protein